MNTLRTRREFLNGTLLGAGAAFTAPAFLHQTISALHAAEADKAKATQPVTGKDAPILVVLQLAGGNDGLNTLVPYADDAYYKSRPRLAVSKQSVLKINDTFGLSPQLPFLKSAFDDGKLAIIQGTGYPNPNRSHFRSTEIWECATDADKVSKTGWLGRYFDHTCAGAPDPTVGVAVSREQPQAFFAEKNSGISLSSPQAYRWANDNDPAALTLFADLNGPDTGMMSGASIGTPGARTQPKSESTLDFLERTALDARVSSDKITKVAGNTRSGEYPSSQLGQSLSLVSRMIAGGLTARVYYVSHGGFDTHNNQSGTHQRLLGELDAALKAFFADLKRLGLANRICLMTFSEFGRRVTENASGGTDHGTAAPLFVLGSGVKPGLYGTAPSLTDLDKGDLKFTTDFRSVYATVLDRWLKTPSDKVLGTKFPNAGFMV